MGQFGSLNSSYFDYFACLCCPDCLEQKAYLSNVSQEALLKHSTDVRRKLGQVWPELPGFQKYSLRQGCLNQFVVGLMNSKYLRNSFHLGQRESTVWPWQRDH